MRWLSQSLVAWAGAAVLAEHFLSLAWGFGVLLLAFVWLGQLLRTTSVKSQSSEQRLNTLIPQVVPKSGGTYTGSLTVNGNHTVGGDQLVSGTLAGAGYGTLSTGPVHMVSSGMTADGTITGHSAINADTTMSASSIHVGGTAQADGGLNINGNTVISSARAISSIVSAHIGSGGILSDGDVSMSSMNGASLPRAAVSATDGTLASTSSEANGLRSRLQDVGIIP